jgi:hypothetical protein
MPVAVLAASPAAARAAMLVACFAAAPVVT